MSTEGNIYIPGPVESDSLILQVTRGCSHNQCTFCSFFKDVPFRVKPYEEIEQDILGARLIYRRVSSVFLVDGDAACLSNDRLRPVLEKLREVFPECDHVNMYGNFRDITHKSVNELRELRELGVKMIYTSLESGSDKVLTAIHKGVTVDEILRAADKLDRAGIKYSGNFILGLGGVELSEEHIRGTIQVLNEMQPPCSGSMVLNPQSGTALYNDIQAGRFRLPTYRQIFTEEREILSGLKIQRPMFMFSGGFLPGLQVFAGLLPEDSGEMYSVLTSRSAANALLLDKEIRCNGPL